MLKSKVLELGKGIKKFMNDKLQACGVVLSSAHYRLILGLIIFGLGIGLGGGLIASAYITVPF
jgi:hypothetical protein